MKKPKQSYSLLQASLRCANDEAQAYLDQASQLREELRVLKLENAGMRMFINVTSVLTGVIRDCNQRSEA